MERNRTLGAEAALGPEPAPPMDPFTTDRWAEIDALFAEALERPPDARTAYLRTVCGDDPALYHAVTALLASDAEAERALGESAAVFASHLLDAAAQPAEDLAPGTRVGPYRVEAEIGRGGMGAVYRAARADGTFEKEVALKLVKRGMDTDEVLRRFRYERQILAGLDHPGVARLLDAGAAADGRPYLVMEFVEGEPITDYGDARRLGLDARLALFEQVCEAVAYAHRHLVVHRDLKPSNVLVAEDETGQPTVKLLDFGIARLLADGAADAPHTRPERRILTPEYAAPEQLRGEAVTTATDVYALGVLLFELLAGRRPDSPNERPSAAVMPEAADTHGAPPHRLRRTLRGDLDTLVRKALHDDRARRYPTAEALLDDLRRRRAGLPLQARPDSRTYRARKFLSRHRWGAGLTAAAVLALIAFLALLTVEQRETARERDRARATAAFLESLFASADPFAAERQDTLRVRGLLDRGLDRARAELDGQPLVRAQLLHVIGQVYQRLGLYPEAQSALDEAVALRRAAPAAPADLAASLVALANVLRERGDPERADALVREGLRIAEQTGDLALRARAELERGLTLQDFGRHDEAEALHATALGRLRALHGEDHEAIAVAEQHLARSVLNQGRFDEAEALYRRAIARFGRIHGEGHPARLAPLRDLAFLLLATGRLDAAETAAAEAVALTRATQPDGSSAAQILTVYGMILRRQEKLDAAEAVLRESIDLPARRSEDRAVPLGTLASVLQQQGDLAGAEAMQREALDLLRTAHGADSPQAAYGSVKLANILREQRRFGEAERLLLDAHAVPAGEEAHHGGDRAAEALVELYEAWGRPEEADRYRTALGAPEPAPVSG